MKTSHILSILLLFSIIMIFAQGSKIEKLKSEKEDQPKVSLPEEYKAITSEDKLYGWYHNDTLHIAFDNQAAYSNIQ